MNNFEVIENRKKVAKLLPLLKEYSEGSSFGYKFDKKIEEYHFIVRVEPTESSRPPGEGNNQDCEGIARYMLKLKAIRNPLTPDDFFSHFTSYLLIQKSSCLNEIPLKVERVYWHKGELCIHCSNDISYTLQELADYEFYDITNNEPLFYSRIEEETK